MKLINDSNTYLKHKRITKHKSYIGIKHIYPTTDRRIVVLVLSLCHRFFHNPFWRRSPPPRIYRNWVSVSIQQGGRGNGRAELSIVNLWLQSRYHSKGGKYLTLSATKGQRKKVRERMTIEKAEIFFWKVSKGVGSKIDKLGARHLDYFWLRRDTDWNMIGSDIEQNIYMARFYRQSSCSEMNFVTNTV